MNKVPSQSCLGRSCVLNDHGKRIPLRKKGPVLSLLSQQEPDQLISKSLKPYSESQAGKPRVFSTLERGCFQFDAPWEDEPPSYCCDSNECALRWGRVLIPFSSVLMSARVSQRDMKTPHVPHEPSAHLTVDPKPLRGQEHCVHCGKECCEQLKTQKCKVPSTNFLQPLETLAPLKQASSKLI